MEKEQSSSPRTPMHVSDVGFSVPAPAKMTERAQQDPCIPPLSGSDGARRQKAIKALEMAQFLLEPTYALVEKKHTSQPTVNEVARARTEIEKALGYLQAPKE